MMALQKPGAIRVTPKVHPDARPAGMFRVLALMLGNLVLGSSGRHGEGWAAPRWPLAIIFSAGVPTRSRRSDSDRFDAADQMIRARSPEKAAWGSRWAEPGPWSGSTSRSCAARYLQERRASHGTSRARTHVPVFQRCVERAVGG